MSWVPNLLTLVRFPLAPWVAVSILRGSYRQALTLLAVAGITDGLDGYAARRLGAGSRLGAWLDPVADKALLVTVYVSLGVAGLIPSWLVWMVVGRDVLILSFAGVALAAGKARGFEPSVWGKLSTLVQIVTGVAVLAARVVPSAVLAWWAEVLPVVTGVTTGWSGIHYAWLALPRQDPASRRDHVPRD
jgi:cardiolipin synthase